MQFLFIVHTSCGSQGFPLQGLKTCPVILDDWYDDGFRYVWSLTHESLGSSGEIFSQIDSGECIGDTLVQSTHWERISKHTSRQIWFAWDVLEQGLIWRVQATAFQIFWEHLEMLLRGRVRPAAKNFI